jgi:gamma-glutamylaminecyclotransferase
VFVYGTLLAGEPNHRLLADAKLVGAAITKPVFALADLGPFPAMVEGGDSAVRGEVYEVERPTLARLDVLEGHPRFYRRRRLVLADGTTAETYVLSPEQAAGRPTISSGDWRARQGVES